MKIGRDEIVIGSGIAGAAVLLIALIAGGMWLDVVLKAKAVERGMRAAGASVESCPCKEASHESD